MKTTQPKKTASFGLKFTITIGFLLFWTILFVALNHFNLL